MKTQQVILTTSVIAAAELTRRRFVGFNGNVCAAGVKALGVVEAGAAIAAGAEVQSDASGKAITKAAGVANGVAWDAAAAAGDVIRIVRGI